jgi:hypothetical protein
MTSRLAQLDAQAAQEAPQCKTGSPSDYFQQLATLLRNAGACKKQGDNEGAYLNLKKYFIIVLERLPHNPQISQHKEEYYFNKEKCTTLQPELDNLKNAVAGSSKPLPPPPVGTGSKPLPPPPKGTAAPQQTTQLPPPPTQQPQQSGGWFSSLWGGKKELPTPPAQTIANQVIDKQMSKLPPPPSDDKLNPQQKFVMNQVRCGTNYFAYIFLF